MHDDLPIPQLMDEAQAWFCAGQVDCAVTIWQHVLSLAPETSLARANLGIVYVKRGQLCTGLRELATALQQNPHLGAAWQALGIVYIRLGQPRKALMALNHAVALQSDEWHGFYHRAYVRGLLQDWHGALKDYTRALHIHPQSRDARNNRGNIYMDLGQYPQAIADFFTLLTYLPDDSLAYYNRGLAYVAAGDLVRGAWDFVVACDLSPSFLEARYNLACVYARMGKVEQARAELRIACSLDHRAAVRAADDPDLQALGYVC
jgi:tetratricopeptide (TPR) repeat protein